MTTKEILAHFDEIEKTRHITLKDIEDLPCEFLTPSVVARYEKCDQYYLNLSAREGKLLYPHRFSGNRLKIHKNGYVSYWSGIGN
jgi:hypothetical protein